MAEDNLIIADTDMFSKAPAAKTAEVNIVAKKSASATRTSPGSKTTRRN